MSKALWIALALAASAGTAQATPLPQLLPATISGALSDIMIGQLAGRMGDTPDVRAFGRGLAEDETSIELNATALAGAMGVQAPTQASDAGRQAYAKLQALEGAEFDRAFLGYAAAELRGEIAALGTLAAGPKGPGAKFAKDAVEALEMRLKAAERLQAGR